jgi:acyl-CoA hydrolase/GNAT superfamily N-acetyltransferase
MAYWADTYRAKLRSAKEAIQAIGNGKRIFIGSSCGEPKALVRELANQAYRLCDIEIIRLLSMESSPLTQIASKSKGDCFSIRSFYLGAAASRSLSRNRRFITPVNLSAVPRLLRSRLIPIDWALVQVSEPDDFGWMSLGVSVDITLAACEAADKVIAQINPRMPRVLGRSFIHLNDADLLVEAEEDITTVVEPPTPETAMKMASHVSCLIEDGSTLQIGLGAATNAVLAALSDRRDLGVHTTYLTDGIMRLVGIGAITNRMKGLNEGKLVASAAVGTSDLYAFIDDNPCVDFRPSDYVANPSVIASHNKMVSLNVASFIDLTGQVSAEAMPYSNMTGVTDIMDFVRGCAEAPEGKSILIIPSTTMDGKRSRITLSLGESAVVVPRGEVHYVVTEYGLVNLFGKSLQERAVALISIAHPDFREELFHQAKENGLLGPEQSLTESIFGVYPIHMEERKRIDGEDVLLRPARPSDERLLQEHFYAMDKEDVIARFMHEKLMFPRRDIEGMCRLDYVKNLTIVAVTGEIGFERVIAVGASFHQPASNTAEVAFSVLKEWQGKGLGSAMLRIIAEAARRSGIKGLTAYTLPENQRMVRLFHSLPYTVSTSFSDGMVCLGCTFEQL